MILAADATAGPPWLTITLAVVGLLGIYATARGPVWLEKAKARWGKPPEVEASAPIEKVAAGEAILREWLSETKRERDKAQREVDRLEKRIKVLEAELYKLGWDGRTA